MYVVMIQKVISEPQTMKQTNVFIINNYYYTETKCAINAN